ncbi:[acyl-carrier-protein] S-malonyltransferase [Idiomarina tyrosinivorans]|uniref:Malonyl CoA-acyl carrier protein transacylase n=1 Tax=Idiomarina tyrosinivorans TaxID=1445662 RepID=A0A432ZU96_9GAMM|nr:ACP S-malonyltransferase [Idiomarina tyrosinivorans]RUO81356.1 [acyl-carrier-protein] S-malonyltransferase [Idiomarina tyrosinivorans]
MTMSKALLFPGQGSQTVGMLADVAEHTSLIKDTFAQASDALGFDLWALVQDGPDSRLNQTENTQPALLTASVALYKAAVAEGLADVTVMAGHSLGEYSALVCAGALGFEDAVKLVRDRGQFMQQAVAEGEGAMAAVIGVDDDVIRQCCAEAQQGQVVAPVNYNSPGQVVIAGHKAAVARAGEALKEKGAKRVLPLPVSVPSHCELMKPAAEQLKQRLAEISIAQPKIAVINNVDVESAMAEDAIRDALVRQLYSPVRWTESVQKIAAMAVTESYEVGPGKVLSGLVKRIDKQLTCTPLNTVDALQALKG